MPPSSANQALLAAEAAHLLARRIVDFWAARDVIVTIRIERHYGDWILRSSLTGRESCERIAVRRPPGEGVTP